MEDIDALHQRIEDLELVVHNLLNILYDYCDLPDDANPLLLQLQLKWEKYGKIENYGK